MTTHVDSDEQAGECVAQYVRFSGPIRLEPLREAVDRALREQPLPHSGAAVPRVEELETGDADPADWVARQLAHTAGGSAGQRHVLLHCADGRIGWYQQVHRQRSAATARPGQPAGDGLPALTALLRRAGDLYRQLTAAPDGSPGTGSRPEHGAGAVRPGSPGSPGPPGPPDPTPPPRTATSGGSS